MYIDTIFGMRWRIPTAGEILFIVFIIVFIVLILVFVRLILTRGETLDHEKQYMLFKSKQKGLTNYQYRILNGMIRIIRLSNPTDIFSSHELFEQSIGQFINYIQTTKEDKPESIVHIMKDIVITYEKLYLNAEVRKPINMIESLENGHFIFFYTDDGRIYLGKLLGQKDKYIILQLFRKPSDIKKFPVNETVHCYLWRSGDAEYTFDSIFAGTTQKNHVFLEKPEILKRGTEVRLPYVNVLIPCTLIDSKDRENKHLGTVVRLAEHEVVFQSSHELNSTGDWSIEFVIDDFTVKTNGSILNEKTVNNKKILYITFKFTELSNPAHSVLKKYLLEHITE